MVAPPTIETHDVCSRVRPDWLIYWSILVLIDGQQFFWVKSGPPPS